jgi:glycosyltransferase involved in cell wall biosynthesis
MVSRLDGAMKLSSVIAAIHAIELLGPSSVVLVIVGGGDAEAEVRRHASAVNDALDRRAVVLTGSLADPRTAYAAADISVGMGGSAARALAFGSPLVAQGENGWSEVFRPESARDIFRRSFWSDEVVERPQVLLADNLRLLLDDPTLRSGLAEFGRDFAVAHFGLDAMAERLAGVYRSAVEQYGAADWMAELGAELGVLRDRLARRGRAAT